MKKPPASIKASGSHLSDLSRAGYKIMLLSHFALKERAKTVQILKAGLTEFHVLFV